MDYKEAKDNIRACVSLCGGCDRDSENGPCHAYEKGLLKGRADIRQIQKLLGHRRLSSTEVYTRVELTDVHEVIARCHPREKAKVKGKNESAH